MLSPATPDAVRRRRVLVVGAVILLLATASITYVVLARGPGSPVASGTLEIAPHSRSTSQARQRAAMALRALEPTGDPETFARGVAEALFTWDTTTLVGRDDHIEQLVAVADPTGQSTPGLVADLGNYLPTQDAWLELAKYETRQWVSIDSTTTPTLWPEAEAQAGPDGLLAGTTAFTIRGVRHRAGVWEGAPVATDHEVAFTVFIVCAPSYRTCHLLRLSMLDKPLA